MCISECVMRTVLMLLCCLSICNQPKKIPKELLDESSGYSSKLFVERKIPSNMLCGVCGKVMKDAVECRANTVSESVRTM